jgi:O-antigen ligase
MNTTQISDDRRSRAVFLLILSIAIVIPGLAWPGSEGLHSFRPLIIQVVALGLLLMMASRAIWPRQAIARFLKTGPNAPILLFVAWSAAAYFRSPNKGFALQQLVQLGGGAIVYYAVVYRLGSRSQIQKLLGGLAGAVIASVLVAGVMLPQQADGRAAGAFGDCQLYASFLVLMLPLMLVTSQADESGLRRLVAQIATVFGLAALLFTLNRSTWLGAVAGLLVLGVLAVRYSGPALAGRKHLILAPALLLVVVLAVFFVVTGSASAVLARLAGVATDPALRWRMQAWAAADRMFLVHPLAGWGLGAFSLLGAKFGGPGLSAAVAHGLPPSLGETAHNQYFQILAEMGLVGLLLYVAILGSFFNRCVLALKQTASPATRWLLIGAMSAIAAQAVDAFGNPSYQYGEVNLFFWLVLGIGIAISRPREEREAAPAPAAVRSLGRPARAGWVMAQAAVLAVGILVIGKAYAGSPPPCYTGIQSCTLTPSNAFVVRPPSAPNCQQYQFSVTFNLCGGGTSTVDLTTDSSTTIATACACLTQPSPGKFCIVDTQACQCRSATITATFAPAPDTRCTATATLLLKPAFGGCTSFTPCP